MAFLAKFRKEYAIALANKIGVKLEPTDNFFQVYKKIKNFPNLDEEFAEKWLEDLVLKRESERDEKSGKVAESIGLKITKLESPKSGVEKEILPRISTKVEGQSVSIDNALLFEQKEKQENSSIEPLVRSRGVVNDNLAPEGKLFSEVRVNPTCGRNGEPSLLPPVKKDQANTEGLVKNKVNKQLLLDFNEIAYDSSSNIAVKGNCGIQPSGLNVDKSILCQPIEKERISELVNVNSEFQGTRVDVVLDKANLNVLAGKFEPKSVVKTDLFVASSNVDVKVNNDQGRVCKIASSEIMTGEIPEMLISDRPLNEPDKMQIVEYESEFIHKPPVRSDSQISQHRTKILKTIIDKHITLGVIKSGVSDGKLQLSSLEVSTEGINQSVGPQNLKTLRNSKRYLSRKSSIRKNSVSPTKRDCVIRKYEDDKGKLKCICNKQKCSNKVQYKLLLCIKCPLVYWLIRWCVALKPVKYEVFHRAKVKFINLKVTVQ